MPKEALARKKAVETDDEDDFRQRALINRKEKQEGGMFKLPEGETIFRILKTPSDKERNSPSVWIEYYVHRNVGPKKVGPVRCGLSVVDDSGSCWLCSMVEKLRENGKTLAAAEIERKKAYAIQVGVWDENLQSLRGPLVWVTSSGKSARSLSYKLESIIAAPASKGYVDHANGYNFAIERSGTGMNDTVYSAPERAEERTVIPSQITKKLKPFADVLNPYDKENQKKAYYGEGGTGGTEAAKKPSRFEEEDEQPKRKPVPIDEDDSIDADPEVDAEEDDDEEVPAKKPRKPVEEDEDDDLEEDDEPVKPKARKPVDTEEDDEDLEFGEDEPEAEVEEAEEEDAPVAKKRPAKKVVEEDDEEEAPKPVRKRR